MTTLQPTRSRSAFRRIPAWAVVVVGVLVGALLVGAGLLLTNGGDDAPVATPGPTCTPSPGTATAPPTGAVKINVYNSTARAGLARDTADALELRGFTIDDVANDPKKSKVAGTAVIRYESTATGQARWAAAQVPDATLEKVSAKGREGAKVDLVIGAGYTALATPAEATTAFAASVPRTGC